MSFCRNCGSVIVNTPVICQNCKNEIPYIPGFCASCGKVIDSRPAYCNFCGKEIRPGIKDVAVESGTHTSACPGNTSETVTGGVPFTAEPFSEAPVYKAPVREVPFTESEAPRVVYIPVANPCPNTPKVPLLPAATVGGYYYEEPKKKRDAGAVVSGIIAMVMGIIGLVYAVFTAFSYLESVNIATHEPQELIFIAFLAPLSVISLVLSRKAAQYGFNSGVTKAARVTSMIGIYTYATIAFLILMSSVG